ncbi:regulator of G protein signaling superfamily [Gigaspora margarita]|uniref:Regulator of G protein signaling superfamily n=1 Tax=Gigaspora margarita TaxID=4874 RepID=A0A8H4EUL6_GIGMA|nr:regulator of G protein signaling superfamily [Gigaspora margarita]
MIINMNTYMIPNYSQQVSAGGSPVRKGIYSTLGILSFIYLTVTIILFYKRRQRIADIRYRPLRLTIFNSIAIIMLCVMFCFRSGFYPMEYPCFLIHWPSYIGFFLVCASITCRAIVFIWVARYHMAKLRISLMPESNTIPISPMTPFTPVHDRMGNTGNPAARLLRQLKKWKKNATDIWMTQRILYPTIAIAFLLAFIFQITSPDLSLIPMRTECPIGSEHIPVFIILSLFLFIICPILIYLLYNIRDAYGLRNELMVTLIVGSFSFIMFFIWEYSASGLRLYFGSFMFPWVTLILSHTLSITIPVWKSYKYSFDISKLASFHDKRISRSKKYEQFEKVLADPDLFKLYKACAVACFCTELILFLEEYQFLKMLVAKCCTPTKKSLFPPPPTPKLHVSDDIHITFNEENLFIKESSILPPLSPASYISTPCTKSIVETVSAASWIPFPYELRTDYRMFYDSYLDLNSDLAINFSGSIVNTVKNLIANDQFELSMYENAREETLTLLYVNTFEKFLRMFESEIRSKKIFDN